MDEFIKTNRDDFDLLEPSEGHLQSFDNKLKRRSDRALLFRIMSYAAMIIVLITVTSVVTVQIFNNNEDKPYYTTEINEIELYYNMQAQFCRNTIESTVIEQQDKEELYNELLKMDSIRNSLESDYNRSGNNSRVQQALVDYYERKLRSISFILNNLKRVNNQKSNEYENVSL